MTFHPVAALIGGLGLFLLGMARLTDGLKIAAGPSLRDLLNRWTSTAGRGLLAGVLITAIVQSSSAVTVATVGFVNAGLLSLTQAVWLIFGTNIGTTMTGWLVALVGVKLDVVALALPMIGAGMALELIGRRRVRVAGLGAALSGFGLFFLGIGILAAGFAGVSEQMPVVSGEGPLTIALAIGMGIVLTLVTQSSSAAVVIGTNIGTTSTAGFAALGATAAARRVVLAHVAFNALTGLVAIVLLKPLYVAALALAALLDPGSDPAPPALVLALFHTLFNVLGVVLMWPLARPLVRWLEGRFVTSEHPGRPRYLDANLLVVPSLALRGLVLEIAGLCTRAFVLARGVMAESCDQTEARAEHEAILEIGGEVRGFIGRLSGAELHGALAGGLADLLRATQHVEEVAALAVQMVPSSLPPVLDGDAKALLAAVEAGLEPLPATMGDAAGDNGAILEAVAWRLSELGRAYRAVKARLLADTVAGRMTPAAMEAALEQVQILRRCAEAGLKAQRRFLPWAAIATGEDADAQPLGRL